MYKKWIGVWLGYCVLAVLVLPLLITLLMGGFAVPSKDSEATAKNPDLVGIEGLFSSELEEYIVGVVSAEMPASFPLEALKAQAVAARTYQVRQMQAEGTSNVIYDVGQAYIDIAQQKEKWGDAYSTYASIIRQAVLATEGEIMVYGGEPILAVFHAQSSGQTESAENIWVSEVPYLQSVDSSGDLDAPNNREEVTLSASEVYQKLQSLGAIGEEKSFAISVLSRSDAGYIQEIMVGACKTTGREVREALGLRSANFTVEKHGENFIFVTYGYGHGAGMSQYGAKYLAEDGKTYREILSHYYQGISFENVA